MAAEQAAERRANALFYDLKSPGIQINPSGSTTSSNIVINPATRGNLRLKVKDAMHTPFGGRFDILMGDRQHPGDPRLVILRNMRTIYKRWRLAMGSTPSPPSHTYTYVSSRTLT